MKSRSRWWVSNCWPYPQFIHIYRRGQHTLLGSILRS